MRLNIISLNRIAEYRSSIEKYSLEVEEQQEIANKMIEKKRLRAQPKESCNLLITCNTIYNGFLERGSR